MIIMGTNTSINLFPTFRPGFILRFVNQKSKQVTARNDLNLKTIFRGVTIIQRVIMGILVF